MSAPAASRVPVPKTMASRGAVFGCLLAALAMFLAAGPASAQDTSRITSFNYPSSCPATQFFDTSVLQCQGCPTVSSQDGGAEDKKQLISWNRCCYCYCCAFMLRAWLPSHILC